MKFILTIIIFFLHLLPINAQQYYSNSNKLNNVNGSKDQFFYDYNGNLIDDKLNVNYGIKYDHRNLISELYHKEGQSPSRVTLFATRYYNDEAGNRVRKLIYTNLNETAGPVLDWNNLTNPGNGWVLDRNEFYVRGADGKELATYNSNNLIEWYVYGNDLVGKIKGTTGYYYFKDHLGSIRAIVNDNGELQSAQDYDAWGYLLESRTYDSDSSKYKFTSKERDVESFYDYFGARYYDARIGRWGQVEPLLEKYLQITPYNYSNNNPLLFIDPDGKDPLRKYLVSANQVVQILNRVENQNKSYWQLSEVFADSKEVRYVYTNAGGFIDLRHFFASAFISSLKGKDAAIILGELMEKKQSISDSKSTDNPEDRPSNLLGAIFGEQNKNKENVSQNFLEYISKLEPVEPNDQSISSTKIYIPFDEYSIPLPTRISYEPYHGEDPNYPYQYRRGDYEP